MGRLARLAAAAVTAAVVGGGGAWAVQDASALGSWRVQRWLESRPGVTAVQDYRCGAVGNDRATGSTLLPESCATLRTDWTAADLARFSADLATYRDIHPADPAGLVEVRAPWGSTLVGFDDGDDWVVAAVDIATSVPGHGPVSIVGGEGRQTATVVVPTRDGLADLAADLSRGLPDSGPPAAFPSGLGFVGPRGRVYVTAPTRIDELGRRAFAEAAADSPDVAVLLRPGRDENPGFVVTLGPKATPTAPDRLSALGVGRPTTRSWVERRDRSVEVATELFSDADPTTTATEAVVAWNAGAGREALEALNGVDVALLEDRAARTDLVVVGDVTTWPRLTDVAAALPAEATDVVVRRPQAVQADPVLDVPSAGLARVAPFLDAVASGADPLELTWVPAGARSTSALGPPGSGVLVTLGDLDERDPRVVDGLLTALASPAARASGAAWAEVTVTVGGDEWGYVVDLTTPTVTLRESVGPRPSTAARAAATQQRLEKRWAALLSTAPRT